MILVSANGKVSVVELLLDDPRVNPSALGSGAMMQASANGHPSVVKLLLTDSPVVKLGGEQSVFDTAIMNHRLDVL